MTSSTRKLLRAASLGTAALVLLSGLYYAYAKWEEAQFIRDAGSIKSLGEMYDFCERHHLHAFKSYYLLRHYGATRQTQYFFVDRRVTLWWKFDETYKLQRFAHSFDTFYSKNAFGEKW